MTRINAAIPVEQLCDQHLLAEHREIKRIPNAVKAKYEKGQSVNVSKIPKFFKLGSGHVIFFYDKLLYLDKRYEKIYQECKRRGFNVTDYSKCFEGIPKHLYNDWDDSDPQVYGLLAQRINERLYGMKNINWNRRPVLLAEMVLS